MNRLPDDVHRCRPDVEQVAESYCAGTFSQPDEFTFEDHYLTCPRCASIVATTDEYIRSMKAALWRFRPTEKANPRGSATKRPVKRPICT
jgi:uncharacterized C2H2 Zn-finger protein